MSSTIPDDTGSNKSVKFTATQADASLMMQILNGPLAASATNGLSVLWSYDEPPTREQLLADHPKGSQGYKDVTAVLMLNETIGTFVKQGLLDRGLVYDLFWIQGAWQRCRAIALYDREKSGVPALYENFEALAQGQTD